MEVSFSIPCLIGNVSAMMMKMAFFILEAHNSPRRIVRLSFSSCSVKTRELYETHNPSETTSGEDI